MLPEEIELIVVTPERQLLQQPVVEVTIPGLDGALGVLPGHAPLMTELGNGELSYRQGTASQPVSLAVLRGFAEVLGNRVTVLAETAERAEEIDLARAEAAKARAEKRLASTDSNIDWDRATVALERAVIRVQVAKKYRGMPIEVPHPA
jgi:F-type H+-transporting ATPase subunit epsilon